MAKILTFRGKEAASSDLDFLTDGNQTLSFRKSDGSSVSVDGASGGGLTGLFPDPKKDWSNQELADLYKVRQLLSGANMPVETERGITDEGDPWFVFCHISGEVFIHLCRIDGAYLLDSPNVLRPLRGDSFSALIADFTNKALPAPGSADASESRVIRLERGGKIRLHPSAMLAALIWTLLMASDELVLLAPEETPEDNDALLSFDGLFTVEHNAQLADTTTLSDADTAPASVIKDPSPESAQFTASENQSQMREATLHQQGLAAHQNGFAIGLSTIAIAMGFMSEVVLLDNQRKVLESLKELGFSDYGQDAEQTARLDITEDQDANGFIAILADFLGLDLAIDTETADADSAYEGISLLQQELMQFTENTLTGEEAIAIKKAIVASSTHNEASEVQPSSVDTAEKTTPTETAYTHATDVEESAVGDDTPLQKVAALDISAILQGFEQADLKEFSLGQKTLKASFEMPDEYTVAIVEWIDTSMESQQGSDLSEFDELAHRLTDFFTSRNSNVSFVEQDGRFIAIDNVAIKEGDVDYIEWQTTDGKIISLVGLHSDFQHFDLTA
ncbi:hypothetical protein Z945_3741 [Sulfitobacter noctilucae]|uniref:hypothetical protein n=1 Tax=Sulfitobacter noctilucae TaxID=1342302 RepID=UPI0004682A39|nr:hypothetical protein [Sulfitobacter noctilucae]KIN70138.1 hypothetical protein Z945_3741 [Sulfitobacter noctilucae]